MERKKYFFIGFIFSFIIILIVIIVFLYNLLTKSIPKIEGKISVEKISHEVNVFRNEYGIPQIIANDEYDLYFTYGYIVAQDRLWQMDILRRTGEGKLSEIFGEKTLETDALMRALGFSRISKNILDNLSPQSRKILQAYADGINAFIKHNKNKLPIEFDILKYEPDDWKIEHSIIILKLFHFQMCSCFQNKIVGEQIIQKIGISKANDLLNSSISYNTPFEKKDLTNKLFNIIQEISRFTGFQTSNTNVSFVISGIKTKNKSPIIASNFNSILTVPSIWYEISIHTNDIDAIGLSIPGIPALLIGSNFKTSWCISNLLFDDCDFYIEQIDSLGLNKYKQDNNWNNLKIINEKIYLKDKSSYNYSIYETNNGSIISNIEQPKIEYEHNKNNPHPMDIPQIKGTHLAFNWIGSTISDDYLGFYYLLKSNTIIEQEEALKNIKIPLSFILCDKNNIGEKFTGLIPNRNYFSEFSFLDGSNSSNTWKGFTDYTIYPAITNPSNGYLISSKIEFIKSIAYNQNIYDRLKFLIEEKNEITLEDIQKMQNDVYSPTAKIVIPYILEVLKKNNNIEYFNQIQTYFKNWDYNIDKSSISSTIYNVFMYYLIKNTLKDELGEQLLNQYSKLSLPSINLTIISILTKKNYWFDDITTSGKFETLEEIFLISLKETIHFLKTELGPDTKNWRWAEIHKANYKHLLDEKKELKSIFNLGPFDMDGSNTTINNGAYYYDLPYNQEIGLAGKFACDMSNPINVYVLISTGISGQALSQYYSNQLKLLLDEKMIILYNSIDKIKNSSSKKLKLIPDL